MASISKVIVQPLWLDLPLNKQSNWRSPCERWNMSTMRNFLSGPSLVVKSELKLKVRDKVKIRPRIKRARKVRAAVEVELERGCQREG